MDCSSTPPVAVKRRGSSPLRPGRVPTPPTAYYSSASYAGEHNEKGCCPDDSPPQRPCHFPTFWRRGTVVLCVPGPTQRPRPGRVGTRHAGKRGRRLSPARRARPPRPRRPSHVRPSEGRRPACLSCRERMPPVSLPLDAARKWQTLRGLREPHALGLSATPMHLMDVVATNLCSLRIRT
jgi:hypothetical protein